MPDGAEHPLLDALLDSWERSNTILVNLLRAIPDSAMAIKPMESSPSIAQLFAHIHYVRLIFVSEDAPEFGHELPAIEWTNEHDRQRLAALLNESAKLVSQAVEGRLAGGLPMDLHYDLPILFVLHMLWHEGYHHGQIKLTLKLAGQAIPNDVAGPISWRVWMNKKPQ